MFSIYEHLESVYQGEDLKLVHKAFDFSKEAHKNQKRASGEEYFIHVSANGSTNITISSSYSDFSKSKLEEIISL